jgi:rubredoxin---NAD+ reductase
MDPLIIIGTGIAGYTLAREFRKLDKETPLVIVTADDGRSYPKPMLSNALTKGKTADQIAMFGAAEMANTLDAEIITHCLVEQINTEHQTIKVQGKNRSYKQLVFAVGACPIRLSIQGDAAKDILTINDLRDYTRFREALESAKQVALIGPGLIGCEFANDLVNADFKVSVVGPDSYPMSTLLPEIIAKELAENLSLKGVSWHLNTVTESINKHAEGYELHLSNGDKITADIVISAIGLKANIKLAQAAGLAVNQGIVTDKFLQTSKNSIYALGDCAEVSGHNLLFIAPILAAAKALAKTLTGEKTNVIYPAMPVAIKTPSYPLVVSPPAADEKGGWSFEKAESAFGIKGLFFSPENVLLGFVLSGDAVAEKQILSKQLPAVLS